MDSVNQRLTNVIDFLKNSREIYNDADFAKRIGKSRSYVSEAKSGSRTITEQFVLLIESEFPVVNGAYILSGEGSMLKDVEENVSEVTAVVEVAAPVYEIPLLPVAVYGGTLDGFGVSGIMPHECEHIVSPLKNAEMAVPVVGDSMSPEYPNGSRVLVRKVNDAAFLEWGAPYVLDTCNGAVLKIIAPSDKQDCIKCISLNKAPEYAPFEVSREHINGMYRVLMCMSLK